MLKLPPILAKVKRKIPKAKLKIPPDFKVPDVKNFKEDMERLGEDIAEGFKERIISNIRENKFGYLLAEETIRRKGSTTPLIDSEQLINAIYREGTEVSVEDSSRTDSDLNNLELAMVHEYGTKDKHIPARPVWRETFEEYRSDAEEAIKDFLDNQEFPDKD